MEEDKQNQVARIQDFDPPKKPKTNKYAIACTFLASLSSILLGYDIGVMSGAILYIKKDLQITDVQVEILVGILNVYSLFGSAAAGRTSDWIGRRYTMVVAAGIFFAGALLMGFATSYAFLMFGRFVAGVGVGYALMVAPVYTAEVSPASSRGFLTSFPEVFINFGILMGYVSNVAFSKLSTHLSWRFMLGIGAIPSVFLAVSVLAMPESPRWLVMQGRLGDARRVLNKTSDSLQEAQFRLADIKQAAGIPENCNDDIVEVPKRPTGDNVWKELVFSPTPAVRHILITGVGIHFFQQASGIDAVVLYSPKIFEKAGIKSDHDKLLCTVAVGVVKTLFILVATFMLDRSGRRRLLLTSVGGMVASLVLLATGLTIIEHSEQKLVWAIALCIAMVLAYVALFSIGMGPITWVYSSEIFPLRLRATGCSIGVAVNRVTSGVVSMTFLSLQKAITIGAAFFLYAALAAVALVFFYTLMPETQGKTLEEMETLFGTFWNWRERPLPSIQTNQANVHYGKMRKSRMPFLLSSHYSKKKKDGCNSSVVATMKRSKSTTTPRNGMHFLNEEEEDCNTPHRRRFWSFLYYSSSSKQQHSKKTERNMTFPSVGNGSMRSKKKEEEFVVVEENENETSPAFDRKVSRSRSVGCGSRSFSGDFFERISTGFGDCTLRRVESQREGNNKSKIHHRNSGAAGAAGAGQDCIKERVRCGGLFSGFMITSSSSSSSSSSHWVSSEENMNGKSNIAPVGQQQQQQQQQIVHGRNRSSWGWAFASPMRAFSKTSSSSSNGKRGASNKNANTPNLAAIPSLLTARG